MQLTIRILGLEMLHVELCETTAEPDAAIHLSGGALGSDRIGADGADIYLGFSNGRGEE